MLKFLQISANKKKSRKKPETKIRHNKILPIFLDKQKRRSDASKKFANNKLPKNFLIIFGLLKIPTFKKRFSRIVPKN